MFYFGIVVVWQYCYDFVVQWQFQVCVSVFYVWDQRNFVCQWMFNVCGWNVGFGVNFRFEWEQVEDMVDGVGDCFDMVGLLCLD